MGKRYKLAAATVVAALAWSTLSRATSWATCDFALRPDGSPLMLKPTTDVGTVFVAIAAVGDVLICRCNQVLGDGVFAVATGR